MNRSGKSTNGNRSAEPCTENANDPFLQGAALRRVLSRLLNEKMVVGGQGKGPAVLLTLTERKTRKEIIRKLKDKTQQAVVRAINGIERQMGKEAFKVSFKSITADNGSEFLDYEALEASVLCRSPRTRVYYAHPYSSWERGSNENANRIIRRFIPKGCDISKFTCKQIRRIEEWINNYPRKILDFKTAEEMFIQELAA